MNFVVTYVEVINGAEATTTERKGTYTLDNINKWDAEGATDPLLVAKFKKAGTDFTDFEEITEPVASSRIGNSIDLMNLPKKQSAAFEASDRIKNMFKKFNLD